MRKRIGKLKTVYKLDGYYRYNDIKRTVREMKRGDHVVLIKSRAHSFAAHARLSFPAMKFRSDKVFAGIHRITRVA